MPTNTEMINSLSQAVETLEGRVGPMETNLTQVLSVVERIAKTMEDLQMTVNELQHPPEPRPDKQPIHLNPPPPY
ncbi:unnamed protein product [Rhodiola kirilowii]